MTEDFELANPDRVTVGTVGPVGERTFLLQVREGLVIKTLKLEKAQVSALARFLGRMLAELERPGELPTGVDDCTPKSSFNRLTVLLAPVSAGNIARSCCNSWSSNHKPCPRGHLSRVRVGERGVRPEFREGRCRSADKGADGLSAPYRLAVGISTGDRSFERRGRHNGFQFAGIEPQATAVMTEINVEVPEMQDEQRDITFWTDASHAWPPVYDGVRGVDASSTSRVGCMVRGSRFIVGNEAERRQGVIYKGAVCL